MRTDSLNLSTVATSAAKAVIEEEYGKEYSLSKPTLSPQLCELRNLITIAYLVTRSASMRHESRGLHYTTDFPDLLDHREETLM